MPAFMIIQNLFNQKCCTFHQYSNGHVWIPIYEFAICASIINIPTEHQLLVKVLAYRKYHRRQFKYAPDQPSKQFLRYGISLTTLKRVVKWGKDSCTVIEKSASSHTSILVAFILKYKKKTSSHVEMYQFIYKKNKKKKWNKMKTKPALNNEMRINDMKMKPCI